MRIFIAGMDTETNTFAPIPTGYNSFEEMGIARGDATSKALNEPSCQLFVWRQRGEEDGHEIIESLCVCAEPGGITIRNVYEQFRDEILAELKAAMPVDCVLLALHGAFVAEGYDDTEGDFLAHVRAVVGPDIPVGAELDLHCHTTRQMVDSATAIVAYKEYPHTDIMDRAGELYRIIVDTVEGKVRPVMALYDCRMISTFRVQEEPMRGFVDAMTAAEKEDGILSVSLGHGFPHGDVEDVGARMLVVTDGDTALAERTAQKFGRQLFALRHELSPNFLGIDEALDLALAELEGPVVIADVSDNAGGGAPGDSTYILRRLVERGITNVASAMYWDPIAYRFCVEAGVGGTIDLRVGGKCGVFSGMPVDLRVTVKGLGRDLTQRFGTMPWPLGDAVWVTTDSGIDLVINTVRTQVFHPECMTALGLDPARKRIIIVKSNYHFQAGFAPIARRILFCAPPGATQPNFASIPYTKLKTPYWPKVEDPFATEAA
ncbi:MULTISPECIES: M81 family metallopeptidase [unclassified Mesorhizobium]|uniref:M81 family metallopeptidase n=1 Tax=unclassified Mesorhizobium TaxID=325217 RepID=UPI00112B354A|nr:MULTISPECIES: M81 family metallopeptidase [unclassified Mesorhizobium]MBZ9739902.1 M81 family metallopeptidase [Mesorhizobium sp. CO1-1-4]MBZ9805715.1 M81 family metallopeptidase [Mesorhizobium sp. ES1-6]TPL88590.1 M81 family metallopeptidase [Mesorhizobium sp. B2-3-12]